MPLDGEAGYSADTAAKQRDFAHVLGVLLRVAESCMRNGWAYPEFHYFDLNAGPGVVGGIEGSPLIFTRAALELGLPFQALFFEERQDAADRLQVALESVCPPSKRTHLRVIVGDHNWTVGWALEKHLSGLPRRWVYGLVYGDGNGLDDIPYGPMAALANRFEHVDQLVNINAVIYKRLRGMGKRSNFLLDDLSAIPKSVRLIREPVGKWQWTMALLTNWGKAPEFREVGFRKLGSPEAESIVKRVNFRAPERATPLRPFVESLPTEAMPSTSLTRGSAPSERSSWIGAEASANGATLPVQPSRTT